MVRRQGPVASIMEGVELLRFCPDTPLDRAWAAYAMVQAKGITVP